MRPRVNLHTLLLTLPARVSDPSSMHARERLPAWTIDVLRARGHPGTSWAPVLRGLYAANHSHTLRRLELDVGGWEFGTTAGFLFLMRALQAMSGELRILARTGVRSKQTLVRLSQTGSEQL